MESKKSSGLYFLGSAKTLSSKIISYIWSAQKALTGIFLSSGSCYLSYSLPKSSISYSSTQLFLRSIFPKTPLNLFPFFVRKLTLLVKKSATFLELIWNLQYKVKIIMTNSHQQLLSKNLLRATENNRLSNLTTLRMENNDNQVLKRIKEIQHNMGVDLAAKQQKILQMNCLVRDMHKKNNNLTEKYLDLQKKWNIFQSEYSEEISQYKAEITILQEQIHSYKQTQVITKSSQKIQQSLLNQLQHEKQLAQNLKSKLSKLQDDRDLLNLQNKNYQNTLSQYRNQITQTKKECTKKDEAITKLQKQLNQRAQLLIKYEKEIKQQKSISIKFQKQNKDARQILLKTQSKEKQLSESLTKIKFQKQQMKSQLTKIQSSYKKQLEQLQKSKQKNSKKYSEGIKQMEKIQKRLKQQITKKTAKLNQYEQRYSMYVKQMNQLHNNLRKIKSENSLLADFKKNSQSNKKQLSENIKQLQQQNKFLRKANQELKRDIQKKNNGLKQLQEKILKLTEQLRKIERADRQRSEQKFLALEKQKNEAIEQWESILKQMNKQRVIINSLQKEVNNYRFNSNNALNFTRQSAIKISQNEQEISSEHSKSIEESFVLPKNKQDNFNFQSRENALKLRKQITFAQNKEKSMNLILNTKNIRIQDQQNAKSSRLKNANCCEECQQQGSRKFQDKLSRQFRYLSEKSYSRQSFQQAKISQDYSKLKYHNGSDKKYLRGSKILKIRNRDEDQHHRIQCNSSKFSYLNEDRPSFSNFHKMIQTRQELKSQSMKGQSDDRKIGQIQQYLSFELKQSNKYNRLQKCNSDQKFMGALKHQYPQSERVQTMESQLLSHNSNNALQEKINKINSWREEPRAKNSGLFKRINHSSNRLNIRQCPLNYQKQNINEIIQKKCRYMNENKY